MEHSGASKDNSKEVKKGVDEVVKEEASSSASQPSDENLKTELSPRLPEPSHAAGDRDSSSDEEAKDRHLWFVEIGPSKPIAAPPPNLGKSRERSRPKPISLVAAKAAKRTAWKSKKREVDDEAEGEAEDIDDADTLPELGPFKKGGKPLPAKITLCLPLISAGGGRLHSRDVLSTTVSFIIFISFLSRVVVVSRASTIPPVFLVNVLQNLFFSLIIFPRLWLHLVSSLFCPGPSSLVIRAHSTKVFLQILFFSLFEESVVFIYVPSVGQCHR